MSSLRQLGRYRIDQHRESRGETDVYQAFDTIRKRIVLLLTLKPEVAASEPRLRRIFKDAETAAELVHPRLGWVWETGEEDGIFYVAERFVNGPSLRERLDSSGALSWEEAAQVLEQVGQGLETLHGQGRVHGAIRPENIYLGSEVGAVLSGIGIPELPLSLADLEAQDGLTTLVPDGAAETGDIETPPVAVLPEEPLPALAPSFRRLPPRFAAAPYTAPEIWMGDPPTPLSDQYALACVLAEMLSGQPLFRGAGAAEVCENVLDGPTLPAAWPPGTPWQVEPVLERGLALQPGERYTNVSEFITAPSRMAERSVSSEDERRQREAQRQARLEAEAQARRQAEEAARLTALERARRELDEQVQRPVTTPPAAAAAAVAAAIVPETTAKDAASGAHERAAGAHLRRRQTERPAVPRARRGWLWTGATLVVLALLWAWSSGRLPIGGGLVTSTAGPTATSQIATTLPAVIPPSDTPLPAATTTPTRQPSAMPTRIRTATPTRTPTPTDTPTPTETTIPTRTPTRERPDD